MGGETGRLSICATPIGNLKDITYRVVEALQAASTIYAEDTRVSQKLLSAYGIKKKVERLDEHTLSSKMEAVVAEVRAGALVAYLSDAGMPGVSDPGLRLVRHARKEGIPVEVLPGPSAAVTAFAASGTLSGHYYFGGFFPRRPQDASALCSELATLDASLLFYESPRRLEAMLQVVSRAFPYREVAVCRELTKLYEEVAWGSADELARQFSARREGEGPLKGEVVVVIGPPVPQEREEREGAALEEARQRAGALKAAGVLTNKEIAACLQEELGISRNAAYRIALG